MIDEETDAELKVISSSFCDPYLLVVREDLSVVILEVTNSGELEELDRGDGVLASQWLSGCLYKPAGEESKVLAVLLTAEGSLRVSSCLSSSSDHSC